MLVVVGGHSRNVGKTSVVAGIVAALPQAEWTAVKITQHGHGHCVEIGGDCKCSITDPLHPYAIDEEPGPGDTDSGRYLAAGAKRSYWARTRQGDLGNAMPALRAILAASRNAILESNSVLNFLVPDLYLAVVDFSCTDMKDSARRFLSRADALVVTGGERPTGDWLGIPARWLSARPAFPAPPPVYSSDELARFVARHLGSSSTH